MTAPGTVTYEGEYATLRYERRYPQAPAQVWAALTDPAHLAGWFAAEVTLEPRVGGEMHMISGKSRFETRGKVLAWEPPSVFAYEWNVAPRPELPAGEASDVRWELSPDGTGTRLVLTHRRLTVGTATGFAPGYHAYLDRLAAQLAGEPLPDWMARYGAVKDQYPAWSRA